jgi:hypothetical protein
MSQGFTSQLPIPLPVAQGGTGVTSTTAYAVVCGGTTSTGNLQSIAGVGTSGQVLTSNGAGALPTFQNAATVNEGSKCWGFITTSGGTPTLQTSYNVTSITDNGTGDFIVTIATDFSTANYSICTSVNINGLQNSAFTMYYTQVAGSFRLFTSNFVAAATDPNSVSFACFGVQ